eukprot:3937604-Pleurochrysis_carterae.AAC.1
MFDAFFDLAGVSVRARARPALSLPLRAQSSVLLLAPALIRMLVRACDRVQSARASPIALPLGNWLPFIGVSPPL